MKEVENCQGVVNRRGWELIRLEVHLFEVLQHVVDGLREGDAHICLEVVHNCLSSHILMCNFERNHH